MKTLQTLVAVTAGLMFLKACTAIYHVPAANVPMMKSRQEFQVGVYGGSNGLDVQAAYALSDHVQTMGSGSFGAGMGSWHKYGEAGLGLYNRFLVIGRIGITGGAGFG